MEQYEIPIKIYFSTIQRILKNYRPKKIFIRKIGSRGGQTVLREEMKDKILTIKKHKDGLHFFIDGVEKFIFLTSNDASNWGKCWSVGYEREFPNGLIHFASAGYPNLQDPQIKGPDDPKLPKVKKSSLRSVNSDYFVQIFFDQKIPLKRSYLQKKEMSFWPHWTVRV